MKPEVRKAETQKLRKGMGKLGTQELRKGIRPRSVVCGAPASGHWYLHNFPLSTRNEWGEGQGEGNL